MLLAEQLEVPLRERNEMLLVAGYAPRFPERELRDDAEMAPVCEAVDVILAGHDPNPAVVVDRGWNLVAANRTMAALSASVAPELLEPPVNVMRVGLHPDGLAKLTLDGSEFRSYFLDRLQRQVLLTGDPKLADLYEEVSAYPPTSSSKPTPETHTDTERILAPVMRMRAPDGKAELAFFFTVLTFGTAAEVTASELAIELGFPADQATAEALSDLYLAGNRQPSA